MPDPRTHLTDRVHFDRIAKAYNSSLPSHVVAHYLDKRAAVLQSLAPAPGPVLDVGCGTGMLAWKLESLGYDVTALDESLGMLQEPPAEGLGNRILGDAASLPVADGAYAAVITVAMLHHIAHPEMVRAAIREMVRVTAPGGVAVIWDHNPLNPYWPLLMGRVPQDAEETRLIPLDEIMSTLQGLSDIQVEHSRLGWVPDFVPSWSLKPLTLLEQVLESVPGIRVFSAHNVVLVRKTA